MTSNVENTGVDKTTPNTQPNSKENKPSMAQVLGSVFAGALGVQSSKNRERDFSQSSVLPYIIGGILFTVVFVGSLALMVSWLLKP